MSRVLMTLDTDCNLYPFYKSVPVLSRSPYYYYLRLLQSFLTPDMEDCLRIIELLRDRPPGPLPPVLPPGVP